MNCTLSKVLAFATGAAIGSVVTWKLLKHKYEQWAQNEIDSVMDYCYGEKKNHADPEPEQEQAEENASLTKEEQAQYEKYTREYGSPATASTEGTYESDWPRVISPDEFGEKPEYETEELTLYADGVLTDEWDNVIDEDEIDDTIGKDSLNHFGEYEDDSVFVRNDGLKTDYQILKDVRNFSDVPKRASRPLGGE